MAGTCRQPWSWLTARLSHAVSAAVAASEKAMAIWEERGQPGDMKVTAGMQEQAIGPNSPGQCRTRCVSRVVGQPASGIEALCLLCCLLPVYYSLTDNTF